MNISKLSVKRPVTTLMCIFIVLIFGFVSFSKISIDLLPNIEYPVAIVSTSYPNVGSEEIEKLVTRPIEQAIATVENIDTISSISSEGNSIVIVQFNFGTDMNFASLKMREKVDMVKGILPSEANSPTVLKLDPNSQPIMQLSVSQGNDLAKVQAFAEDTIKPALERIEGVASVSISGGYEKEVVINTNAARLKGYGLSIDYIAQILSAENLNLPGGTVKKGNQELFIRNIGEFTNLEEIKKVPIPLKTGGIIYLSDVADISFQNKDKTSISKLNGKETINISIQKQSGTNTVKIANQINKQIDKLKSQYSNLQVEKAFDQSEYISKSISNVSSSAITGSILAVLILYIFLRNIRSTFIIGTSIPISIIATFILIYFNGITLNLMTLGGLALGVGMLVDNSIVVLENIYRYRQQGYSKVDAAIQGTQEVMISVIASTLTTVAVFLPIAFAQGITAIIFKELALTVTFSLAASLIVSLTLVPMLSSKLLKIDEYQGRHHEGKNKLFAKIYDGFDKVFAFVESKYKGLLAKALKHRKITIIITLAAFISSMASLAAVGFEFFPATDEGQFTVSVELPEGSKVKDSEQFLSKIENKIKGIKEIKSIFSSAGGGGGMSFTSSGQNKGSLTVNLVPLKERKRSTADVVDEVRNLVKDTAGAKINIQAASSSMGGVGSAISIEIKGDNLNTLKNIGNNFKNVVESVDGTREVKLSLTEGAPEVQVKINREKASQYGITAAQLSTQIKGIMDGKVATKYKIDGDELDVVIKGDDVFSESISNLKQVLIQTPTGINVPLELIADVSINQSTSSINRENQVRTITVNSDIYGRDLKSITDEISTKLSSVQMPEGYTYEMGGENEQMMDAFSDLILALGLAVILVYMILAAQFESLIHPFTIMFAVPLAFSGGIFGLFITRRTFSVPAFIGLIILAGIVVNNAIVLIDYIKTRRGRGEDREEAILNAGPTRLRPILMTTLTTVLGLVPMALGIGDGAEIQAPLATVVIGGLTLSTLLTLVIVPVTYTLFDDLTVRIKKRLKRTINKEITM
ncbi:HAE1 family hydrophobic/amphiphilic exporter-1 [Clostridium pascui]|uniref:efflux RND transporter permease subunit n=1 Tax=Clostridium pascui TaxID=46609 RepID=UPI0019570FE7|nr:efflux RND transporter permease subunit [Clostridium pascui]MBM7870508.1 HAE1 family hydrophobic/amphiphilic exporter-1 [Clostridium pascui]